MEIKCEIAKTKDIKEIKKLFETNFNVKKEEIDLFFNKKFELNNCLVCKVNDNTVASALHLMEATILCKSFNEKAYYVYAASTLPEYRNNGLMRTLLEYSVLISKEKGKKYLILLPETKSLYEFYEKLGYKKFFRAYHLKLSRKKLCEILESNSNKKDAEIYKISKTKDQCDLVLDSLKTVYKDIGGVLFTTGHINYAIEQNILYAGMSIIENFGFAFCSPQKDNSSLEICEFFLTDKKYLFNMLFKIFKNFDNFNEYTFKMPINYFDGILKSKAECCGMVRSVGNSEEIFKFLSSAYMGFTL